MTDKKATLVLTVKVTYELNGTPIEDLKSRLRYIASNAAAEGMMTGDSEALVETWDARVGRIAAAPSDYSVLAEELSCPEALDVMQRDDPLADARIRGFTMMDRLLQAEGGYLNVDTVAKQLRMSRQGVDKRRKARRLLAIELGRRGYVYPRWQFTERGVLPGLEEVLVQLQENAIPSWDILTFFLNKSHLLGDSSPLSELREGNLEGVLRAAAVYGEQGAA